MSGDAGNTLHVTVYGLVLRFKNQPCRVPIASSYSIGYVVQCLDSDDDFAFREFRFNVSHVFWKSRKLEWIFDKISLLGRYRRGFAVGNEHYALALPEHVTVEIANGADRPISGGMPPAPPDEMANRTRSISRISNLLDSY